MATPTKPLTSSLIGIVGGAIALILVTAILTSAVSSSNADSRTEALASKLEKVTNDLTALRDNQDAQQTGTLKARANLMHNNDVLQYQNRVLQQKVLTLIRLLRAQGIQPPASTLPPPSTASPSADPKAPRRHPHPNPGSPAPTAPSPTTSPSCVLLPVACPFLSLPTLLP